VEDKPHTSKRGFNLEQLREIKSGFRHKPDITSKMVNSQNYLEFSLDLNGTSVSGSDSTTMDVQNKYVSFIHRLDTNTFYKKVYSECAANSTCRAVLKSDS